MKTLDLRGLQCPHPVIQSRKALLDDPGCALTVLVGDETARDNLGRLAASLGYNAVVTPEADAFRVALTPSESTGAESAAAVARRTVVFITAETMGSGDDELGRLLLKNFLITLTEMDDVPETIYLVNAGVKLVCAGSELLEVFDKLGCQGIDIAACGLCLEFFHLKEQLAVGRTTNMLEIAGALQAADNVIRP